MGLQWPCGCTLMLPGSEGGLQALEAGCARCWWYGPCSAAWRCGSAVSGPAEGTRPSSRRFTCTRAGMLSLLQLPGAGGELQQHGSSPAGEAGSGAAGGPEDPGAAGSLGAAPSQSRSMRSHSSLAIGALGSVTASRPTSQLPLQSCCLLPLCWVSHVESMIRAPRLLWKAAIRG